MLGPQDKPSEEQIKESSERKENAENAAKSPISTPLNDTEHRFQVAKVLGVDSFGEFDKAKIKVDEIVEWAQSRGAEDIEDVIDQIRELRMRLGAPGIGSSLLEHLSVYTRLEMEKMKLDKKLKVMER